MVCQETLIYKRSNIFLKMYKFTAPPTMLNVTVRIQIYERGAMHLTLENYMELLQYQLKCQLLNIAVLSLIVFMLY